ncbi:hypothetical protein SNE40_009279 [Patella caerulea]|uniref:RING-type domain-containing protein n=1 Tax=Patella caerulea TaxID=87958 RepID=A0AAN8JRS9_PATCE
MGLCKCPKRKVTNLFCFEHRVNVCEHCLVANHPKCIVQSYLQWLQDSDYNPICKLCNQALGAENAECVRLVCYDIFHWNCIDKYARSLPPNTAPAGYTCPTCNTGIFPPANMASPIADVVKTFLSRVNWARAGLGLPLIEEAEAPVSNTPAVKTEQSPPFTSTPFPTPNQQTRPSAQVPPYSSTPTNPNPHSVISVDAGASSRGLGTGQNNPRKLFDTTTDDDIFNMSQDHDEDKYKRRPAFHWLAKWFKSTDSRKRKDPNAVMKKFLVVLGIGIISFLTLIIIFSKLGHEVAENDPNLDPMANPNIRVNEKIAVDHN